MRPEPNLQRHHLRLHGSFVCDWLLLGKHLHGCDAVDVWNRRLDVRVVPAGQDGSMRGRRL